MKTKTWISCAGVPRKKHQPWSHSTQQFDPCASAALSSLILTHQQILQRSKGDTVVRTVRRLEESGMGSGARSVGASPYNPNRRCGTWVLQATKGK